MIAGEACCLPNGCGPRNLTFHPILPLAYVICEKSSEVIPLSFNYDLGTLEVLPGTVLTITDNRIKAEI
jgi:6-phosphogluconolactonase